MQNNKIQIKSPIFTIIGLYEPEGSSLLTADNPQWVGGCVKGKRNDRARYISTTIGVLIAFGCSLLIQNYVEINIFV